MKQRTLILLHGFTAVFFLPIAILYALTGVLYILGESGYTSDRVLNVSQPFEWPATEEEAFTVVNDILKRNALPEIAGLAELRLNLPDKYLWLGLGRRVTIVRSESGAVEIQTQEHSLLRRMVEIHKDHSGVLFTIIGVGFGLAMFLLLASGAYMMFTSRLYRRNATVLLAAGTVMSVAAYFTSL